jgi:single-strand DNA-binding protein
MNNNSVDLTGYVGGTPLLRSTRYGKDYMTFSMATTEYWPGTRNVKRTVWHNVIAWQRNLISYIQKYLKKGSPVEVQGSIVKSKYEKDGAVKYYTKVEATDITFLTKQMLDVIREQEKKEYDQYERKSTFDIYIRPDDFGDVPEEQVYS